MSGSPAIKPETTAGTDLEEIKLYSDYKSPYAYLAFDPGFALEKKRHYAFDKVSGQGVLSGRECDVELA